jgi:hypothetical protein
MDVRCNNSKDEALIHSKVGTTKKAENQQNKKTKKTKKTKQKQNTKNKKKQKKYQILIEKI